MSFILSTFSFSSHHIETRIRSTFLTITALLVQKLADLREKRIIVPLTESPRKFCEVLYQNFMKLRNSGGFELLRNERNFRDIMDKLLKQLYIYSLLVHISTYSYKKLMSSQSFLLTAFLGDY